MKTYLKTLNANFKNRTKTLTSKEKFFYVVQYYWYYFLIPFCLVVGLIWGMCSFTSAKKNTVFTCVFINQSINVEQDLQLQEEFANILQVPEDRVEFDSNYRFSYEKDAQENANESFFELFFLRWRNNELDAVIMPESFYEYCIEQGGSFRALPNEAYPNFSYYKNALVLNEENGEKVVLAFPETKKSDTNNQAFLAFIYGKKQEGMINFEAI